MLTKRLKINDADKIYKTKDAEANYDVRNIEEETIQNDNFRKVLFTGKHIQLVLMSLQPNEDIGEESHSLDQFFRIESGSGICKIGDNETQIEDGFSIIIAADTKHNIIAGNEGLKLYTLYAPPNHPANTLEKTKTEH